MKLSGSYQIDLEKQKVWESLNDPNILKQAIPCVYNNKDLSGALTKNFSSSAIDNVKISTSGMNSDIHASAEYRANMVKVFAKKAVEAC